MNRFEHRTWTYGEIKKGRSLAPTSQEVPINDLQMLTNSLISWEPRESRRETLWGFS